MVIPAGQKSVGVYSVIWKLKKVSFPWLYLQGKNPLEFIVLFGN